MATLDDFARVVEFRNRVVAYANYVGENVHRYEGTPRLVENRVAEDQSWLSQEYGRIYRVISPYGLAQNVVRDAIQAPTHAGYADLAQMAVGHIDQVIGHLRAAVEDGAAARTRTPDDLYRMTSPLYWVTRLWALIRWVVGTTRGRIASLISLAAVAIIGGIVSGVAQGWYQQVFAGQ